MAGYADGFLLPIPKKKLAAYRRMARLACRVWMDLGALQYREAVIEDDSSPCGIPFAKRVKAKRGEVVLLAWILYRNKAHRDRVNAKVMKDRRIGAMMSKPMPFDMNRMSMAGFEVIVAG